MNTMLNINPWSVLSELLDADSRAFKSMSARAAGRFPPVNVQKNTAKPVNNTAETLKRLNEFFLLYISLHVQ